MPAFRAAPNRIFYSTEAWHRIMAVNATGVFFGIKHAIPAMVANGGGSLVNLSSIAGIIGSEHVHMAYNASKAAVRLMTKSVAVQHAKDNIRANSIHPGIMPPMRTSGRTADPAVRTERMRVVPMRRPGEVDEVAYAILFLASMNRPTSQVRKSTSTAEFSLYRPAPRLVGGRHLPSISSSIMKPTNSRATIALRRALVPAV